MLTYVRVERQPSEKNGFQYCPENLKRFSKLRFPSFLLTLNIYLIIYNVVIIYYYMLFVVLKLMYFPFILLFTPSLPFLLPLVFIFLTVLFKELTYIFFLTNTSLPSSLHFLPDLFFIMFFKVTSFLGRYKGS